MRIRRCALTLNIFMNGFSGFSSVFSAAWSAPVATLAVAAASKVASVTTPLLLSSAEDTTSILTTSASTAAAEMAVSLAPPAAANSGLDRNTAEAARRFTRGNDDEDAKPARRPRKRRVGGGLNAWLVQSRRPHATKAALVVIAILMGKKVPSGIRVIKTTDFRTHGKLVESIRRPRVHRRCRSAAGCGGSCSGPSPGCLAGRKLLPPAISGNCRFLLRTRTRSNTNSNDTEANVGGLGGG
jgi:hypothetical protein